MDISTIMQEYIRLIPNVFNDFSTLAANAPLSHLQLHVLDTLSSAGSPLAVKSLRAATQVSRQQLNAVLNTMVANDLIERRPNPDDGRSALIALTASGQALNQARWQTVAERTHQRLLHLDADQQLDLYYSLHKLNHLLSLMEENEHATT